MQQKREICYYGSYQSYSVDYILPVSGVSQAESRQKGYAHITMLDQEHELHQPHLESCWG